MVNPQDSKAKELLEKSSIRTMRKDIQKLREFDSREESRRIVQLKPPSSTATDAISNMKPLPIREKIEAILKEKKEKDEEITRQAKAKATEAEKQHIFALESERAALESPQISEKTIENPIMATEKNSIKFEQEATQRKLKPLIIAEEKVEARLKEAETKASSNIVENQSVEQERSRLEEQREKIEKERWLLERRLKELGGKMEEINTQYQHITNTAQQKKNKLSAIEDSLHEVHSNILQRTKTERTGTAEENPAITFHKKDIEKKDLNAKEEGEQLKKQEETPQHTAKLREKLQESVKKEEFQRKKFLEDVETWVASSKKHGKT